VFIPFNGGIVAMKKKEGRGRVRKKGGDEKGKLPHRKARGGRKGYKKMEKMGGKKNFTPFSRL